MHPEDITHRRIVLQALPIVLANVAEPLLALADTAVIGQLGRADAIGAVGLGSVILTSIYWVFGFLRMGTSGMVAQARGAGNVAETGAILMRGILMGCAIGLAMVVLQYFIINGFLALAPATLLVEDQARSYMFIRIWSAPFAIAVFAMNGWLIAMEKSGAVVILQIAMNGINVAFSMLFVWGFNWGVEGVAIGTFIAECFAFCLGLYLTRKAFQGDQWRDWRRIFDAQKIKHMAAINGDIMIRTILLLMVFNGLTIFGSMFGDVTLAANQIMLQILSFVAHALDGFAFTAESFVGQALGARSLASLRRSVFLTAFWGGLLVIFMTFLLLIGVMPVVEYMTPALPVQEAVRNYLPWLLIAPLIGFPSWMLDGIFIGATRTRDMRNGALISALIFFAVLIPAIWLIGNHGIWFAMLICYIARAATLWVHYPKIEAEASEPLRAA